MQHVSYYRSATGSDNAEDLSTPLRVNCCGIVSLGQPFSTFQPQGRNDYYFLYMAEGGMDIWIDGAHFDIFPGDLVIYPPHTRFRYALSEGHIAYYWIHFTGSMAASLLQECALEPNVLLHPGLHEDAVSAILSLHRCFITRGQAFDAECAGYLAVILACTGRRTGAAKPLAPPSAERVQRSLEYLHSHYSQPVSVQTLSAMEYLSPSRYSAVFRACTGLSPQQYLISLRLRGAKDLILTTDMPLGQIARAVGYEDQLYFSRLFKRSTGLTPSEYRRAVRAGQTTP